MKLKTDMTPGVVGTALAAVAAGSLVLFSLVLQQSAFDTSSTNGLKALSPGDRAGQKILVEAAPEENDSTGGEATVAETSGSEEPSTPTTATESFSPIADDDLVADTGDASVSEFPTAGGDTGNTLDDFGIGATARDRGPQATISKDPNGRPGDVELPDRNGPKNTAPPHGSDPDRGNDDSDDRADRDEPQNDRQRSWSKDRSKNDRQKAWAKGHSKKNDRQKAWSKDRAKNDRQRSWAKSKQAKKDKSRDSSSRDKNKSSRDKHNNGGKSNNGGKNNNGGDDRDHHSNNGGDREDRESEDRNDRHDSRRDSDDDDDDDGDDDDDDRHDDSHHSNDDSRGHSGSHDPKH